jgi:hypothetical protein
MMGVLLAADEVKLFPASDTTDAHGWVLPGTDASWSGMGSLQLTPGSSDPAAADGGGHGPFDPAAVQAGSLYLPLDAGAAEGDVAIIRGESYVLSQVRLVVDPTGGGIDCVVATVSGTATWSATEAAG